MCRIETERLFLQTYTGNERAHFVKLMTDRRVMEKVGDGVLKPAAADRLWLRILTEHHPYGIKRAWAVCSKDNTRYVGHAMLHPRPEEPSEWEIGYILRQDQWGKGLATEIARALVIFGFDELGLDQIIATIDDDHVGSIKVANNAGLEFDRYEYDQQGRFSVYSIRREKLISKRC